MLGEGDILLGPDLGLKSDRCNISHQIIYNILSFCSCPALIITTMSRSVDRSVLRTQTKDDVFVGN